MPAGAVRGVEILDYRETRGGEVARPPLARAIVGKRNGAPLALDNDIQNISGATLSCRHVTEGVRRLLALHERELKPTMNCRARPLLGTFVSIRTDGDDGAVDAAFAAIERVHRLMSPQDPDSDAFANQPPRRAPSAGRSPPLDVRGAALRASHEPCLGGHLRHHEGRYGARHEDVELIEGRRVRLRSRARLDLGGIAKGFAVDRGVEALRRHGARQGSVNAAATFGRLASLLLRFAVRAPGALGTALHLGRASERAYATSAGLFRQRNLGCPSARRTRLRSSITVSAPTCAVADALTKVIAICGAAPRSAGTVPRRGLSRR